MIAEEKQLNDIIKILHSVIQANFLAKDATAHIEGDIDYDIFVSVYKK